jgi:hypothetical protein
MDHCGGSEPWEAAVAEMISTEYSEGGGGMATGVDERVRGGRRAHARCSRVTTCKGKGNERGARRHSF